MSVGRERMLAAIRGALADIPGEEAASWSPEEDRDPAAAYARATTDPDPVALFAERCGEYRATVCRCAADAGAIGDAVAAVCARAGVRSLAVAPGVPAEWIPPGVARRRDEPPLTTDALDAVDGALTAATGAIAVTGTLVLDGSPPCGRRALTLVPDVHVCVVDATTIVTSVPEAIHTLISPAVERRGAPVTLVSGPSATSDIELERVEGVHGPRHLRVIVAGGL